MSAQVDERKPLSPDDVLPPVEPPSAGFIVQLFIVPAVMVSIIVAVWLAFNWLARASEDPHAYIRQLQRDNNLRWQVAVNLANALRNPRNDSLREDREFAKELAAMLEGELASGRQSDEDVKLRLYLCKVLGEFSIADGLPTLLKVAATERSEQEVEVRWAALGAIALLADNMKAKGQLAHADLHAVLMQAAGDEKAIIRSAAAFALGVMGDEPSLARLEVMLADAHPDVRYNAATGLARHGKAVCADVLAEMLDPLEMAGVEAEGREGSREFKRALIQVNALRAVGQLTAANADLEVDPLREAIRKLLAASPNLEIQVRAKEVLHQISQTR